MQYETMPQCYGRLIKESYRVQFAGGGSFFHLPIRCASETPNKLCSGCAARAEKTAAAVEKAGGKALINHGALLHGCIDEPIPYWSHLYDGPWYRLKVAGGAFLSEETMAKVKAAVEKAQGSIPTTAEELPKKVRKVKVVAATIPTEEKPQEAPQEQEKPQKQKRVYKKKEPAAAAPKEEPVPVIGIVTNPVVLEVDETVEVEVDPITIEDHSYYIHWGSKKVYNTKCKYMGRLNSKTRTIDTSFPDSDAE